MLSFVMLCCLVAVNAQHDMPNTQTIRHYLDISFGHYDHTPNDGLVEENEWDSTIYGDDLDNNTCVDLQEYLSRHSCPVAAQLYAHYDHDSDGCLNVHDMSEEFHFIDKDGDNTVTLHEWEQYFQHLNQKLFGHNFGHTDNGHHQGR